MNHLQKWVNLVLSLYLLHHLAACTIVVGNGEKSPAPPLNPRENTLTNLSETPTSNYLQVLDSAWTNKVNADKNPVERYHQSPNARSPLFFWNKLQGDSNALNQLRTFGKLGIWHMWYHNGQLVEQIYLPIGDANTFNQLQAEVQATGIFTWRIWSKGPWSGSKKQRGNWQVMIRDDQAMYLSCGGQPCQYHISVK